MATSGTVASVGNRILLTGGMRRPRRSGYALIGSDFDFCGLAQQPLREKSETANLSAAKTYGDGSQLCGHPQSGLFATHNVSPCSTVTYGDVSDQCKMARPGVVRTIHDPRTPKGLDTIKRRTWLGAESPGSREYKGTESRVRSPEYGAEGTGSRGEREGERMEELEMARVVEQMDHATLRLMAARPELFARHGSVVATWRQRPHPDPLPTNLRSVPGEGTCCYGPYHCLSYRDEGRQRSIYLGWEGPLVEEVRRRLEHLQRPLRERWALDRLRRKVATALRADNRQLDAQLRAYGLRIQGFEVRGWRTSILRGLASPKPPTIRPLQPIRCPKYNWLLRPATCADGLLPHRDQMGRRRNVQHVIGHDRRAVDRVAHRVLGQQLELGRKLEHGHVAVLIAEVDLAVDQAGRTPDLRHQVVRPMHFAGLRVETMDQPGNVGDHQQVVLDGGHAERAVHGLLEVALPLAIGGRARIVPHGGRVRIGPQRLAGRLRQRPGPAAGAPACRRDRRPVPG